MSGGDARALELGVDVRRRATTPSRCLCAERPVDEAAELAKREAEWAAEREKLQGDVARAEEARASEGARYQETIARLQQQLSAEPGPRPSTVSFRVE